MRKVKDEPIDSGDGGLQDDYALPARNLYYAYPARRQGEGRRQLTERDIKRNEGVDRLFDSVRPGLPIDADPPEMHADPIALSSCVEKLLGKFGVGRSPWVNRLSEHWAEVAGEDVAAVSRPGKWDSERRILYVYVDNAQKLFELQRTKTRMIESRIRTFSPEQKVAAVRFMQQL